MSTSYHIHSNGNCTNQVSSCKEKQLTVNRNPGFYGVQNFGFHLTLIISTSWSTPLAPGKRG